MSAYYDEHWNTHFCGVCNEPRPCGCDGPEPTKVLSIASAPPAARAPRPVRTIKVKQLTACILLDALGEAFERHDIRLYRQYMRAIETAVQVQAA